MKKMKRIISLALVIAAPAGTGGCAGKKNVSENSEVIIFGGDKENAVTLDELAKIANTINYELLCILSKRVPRIYVRKNQLVDQLNYICPDKNDNE